MQYKKVLFVMIVIVHIFSCFVFLIVKDLKTDIFLSYEMAFLSSFLVIFTSYLNYKKLILKKSKIYEKDFKQIPSIFIQKKQIFSKILHFKTVKDDLNLNIKDKIHFFAMFFTLFKFIAYIVLIGGFLVLNHWGNLNILAYISGVLSLIICIFIFILYVKKYESKKNY